MVRANGTKEPTTMKRFTLAVSATLLATMLTGCVVALGNRGMEDTRPNKLAGPSSPPTLGKQLSDLKQARDSGALTEEEYQTAKKRLLDSKVNADHHAH